jgi:hypothetical protein
MLKTGFESVRLSDRWLAAVVFCVLTCSVAARADEVQSRDLLPDDAVVLVEIDQPLQLLDHPIAKQLWATLQESHEAQRLYDSPEYDQLRAVVELLRQDSGLGWRDALQKATAGGILFAAQEGTPPKTTLVLTADTPKTLIQLGSFVKKLAEAQVLPGAKLPGTEAKTYRNLPYYKAGNGYYAVVGRRLIATSSDDLMQKAFDRLIAVQKRNSDAIEAPVPIEKAPLARVTIDAKALRKSAGAEETLKIPTANFAQVFLAGDTVDLARRSDRVVVEVFSTAKTLDLTVRFSASKSGVTPGLEGFFAVGDGQQAAPLLKLPNTLYATSWFRDYRAIWNGRAKLLTEASRKSVEAGDQTIMSQLAVVGAGFRPSDMFKSLGTHFRFVVARQNKSVYKVKLDTRFPAAAFVIDLRDEEYFRTKVIPALRAAYGLATISQQPRILAKVAKHKKAELLSLIFDDDDAAAAVGDRSRYNISPTFTVTRGHFVIGSTREIVEQVIDELDKQQAAEPKERSVLTSRQLILLPTAADLAKEFQSPLVRNIVFSQGLSVKETEHELGVLLRIVSDLGQVSVTSGFDEQGYQYRVKLGPVE